MFSNERGSIAILALYTVLAVIAGTMIISHFFGVYVVKRQSQNVADSASLAAVQVLKQKYEEEMKDKVDYVLHEFWVDIDLEIATCLASGVLPCLTKEELVEQRIQDARLRQMLLDPTSEVEWLLVVTEPYFSGEFTAQKNGDRLYDVCRREASAIRAAALDLSVRNEGSSQLTLTFPVDGEPKVQVKGHKTINIDQIVTFSEDIPSYSAAGLQTSFDIDVSHKVPFDF
ncbi:pilus assembly protein TadG-related protein [Ammoniphilus sp. CFH 90114]|uniref:pilus assembly protein TadG-related protein n=1 Tax=Ammoniphilus sp. CFH 90114 TaxID=2493665 RepID=UPI00100E4BEC|nr:Tad domain-containing protein [Ammoniphilus sp. CFH 90114]RXT07825.1 hypothetical protein EIZ39_10370 [Ammoniphilus sp. CFH 90114]